METKKITYDHYANAKMMQIGQIMLIHSRESHYAYGVVHPQPNSELRLLLAVILSEDFSMN